MALDWRTRRKALYLGVPILLMFLVGGFMTYRAMSSVSCDNGRQDGGEIGIDCEGPCAKICEARIKPLVVEWARFAEVDAGRYNVMAVIDNQNPDLGAAGVAYTLALYSGDTKVWEERGITDVPVDESFSVFAGPVRTTSRPTRATVDIETPSWMKQERYAQFEVIENRFSTLDTTPRLETTIRNTIPESARNVEVGVALYDDQDNAVHLSRTVLDVVNAQDEATAVFTWPRPFGSTPGVCAEPFAAVLAIDRSGSMNEDQLDPPEPLTGVKNAALSFMERVGSSDEIGLVTFATEASVDVQLGLSARDVRDGISSLEIKSEDETGYTNIGDALKEAQKMLTLSHISGKSVILLTDGRANWPESPTGEAYAIEAAESARADGISLYGIGLGSSVGAEFLASLTGDPSRVFEAPAPRDLYSIYEEIGTRLCEREPYRVEVYIK